MIFQAYIDNITAKTGSLVLRIKFYRNEKSNALKSAVDARLETIE